MEETVADDSVIVSTPSTTSMRQTHAVSCPCKICGVPARYSYYGAIVCHPCKMFFKRNAGKGKVNKHQNVLFFIYIDLYRLYLNVILTMNAKLILIIVIYANRVDLRSVLQVECKLN